MLCDSIIPEGRQVCLTCESRVEQYGCPTGYITAADVSRMSGLRGMQVQKFIDDYGIRVCDHGYVKYSVFSLVRQLGRLSRYKAYVAMRVRTRK